MNLQKLLLSVGVTLALCILFNEEAKSQNDDASLCIQVNNAGRTIYNTCSYPVAIQTIELQRTDFESATLIDLDLRGSVARAGTSSFGRVDPNSSAYNLEFHPKVSRESLNYYAGRERYGNGLSSNELQWAPIVRPGEQVGYVQLIPLPIARVVRAKPISW